MSIEFHPFAEVFPLLPDGELAELAEDIKIFGLREPIWLYEGKILDGRNRWLACQKARKEPQYRTFKGTDKGAKALVISANIHRRQLTVEQRAMAVARLSALKEQGGDRRSENFKTAAAALKTDEDLAKQARISPDSVQRARKIVEKGSEALQEAVERGDVSLTKGASVTNLPKPKQLTAARASKKAPEPSAPEPEKPDVSEDEEAEALAAAEREFNASLDKILKADDRLAAAVAETRRQAAEIASLKQARNQFMNEKREAVRLLKAEQRKCEGLQKKLKVAEREIEKLRGRMKAA